MIPACVTKARKLVTEQNQTIICTMGVRLESDKMTWFNDVDIVTAELSGESEQRLPNGGLTVLRQYDEALVAYAK